MLGINITHKFKVNSRKDPKVQYLIHIFDDGSINCSCLGYSYRSRCAHVTYIKNNLEHVKNQVQKRKV